MKHSKKFLVVGLIATINAPVSAKEDWQNTRKAENQEFYSIISEEASVSEALDKRVFRNTVKMIDRKNSSVELAHPGVSITPSKSQPLSVTSGYREANNDPFGKSLAKQFEYTRLEMYRKPFYKIPVVVKPDDYGKVFSHTLAPRPAISEAEEIKNSIDRAFLSHTTKNAKGSAGTFNGPRVGSADNVNDALQVTSSDMKSISSTEVGNELFNTRLRPTKRKGFFDVLKEVFSGK